MQMWLVEKYYFHEVIIWMYNCQLQAMAFGAAIAWLLYGSNQYRDQR